MNIERRVYTCSLWSREDFDFFVSAVIAPDSIFEPYHIAIGGGYDLAPEKALYSIMINRKDKGVFTDEDVKYIKSIHITLLETEKKK